jgi:hypothetical protein
MSDHAYVGSADTGSMSVKGRSPPLVLHSTVPEYMRAGPARVCAYMDTSLPGLGNLVCYGKGGMAVTKTGGFDPESYAVFTWMVGS